MATALRPLSLGELLDRTFQLYRRHFILFVGISAIPNGVVLAFQLVNVTNTPLSLAWLLSTLGAVLISFVGGAMAQAATVYAVSQLYLDRLFSITDAFSQVLKRLLLLLLVVFLVGVMIVFGLLALIVPGIYLLLRFALIAPAVVIEGRNLGGALQRSAELMNGQYGRVLLIYILFFVLTMVFSGIFQVPLIIALVAAGMEADGTGPIWFQVAQLFINFLSTSVIGPLLTIAIALVYYDVRVRREGFDLEHMVAQLEGQTAAAPAAAH